MNSGTPGFPVLHCLPEFAQTHVHWVNDAIKSPHPLLPTSSLALSFSQYHGLFQWVGSLHQVAKYWSFSFSISSCNGYSGLISFRIDWFDFFCCPSVAGRGPLPGPETGLLSNTGKWVVRGDTCADKARDFIGNGHPGGEHEGKGTQENCSASWLAVLGFMVMGLVSR